VYAKFHCVALLIEKALGIFRELITTTTTATTTRTTRVALQDPPSGSKNLPQLADGSGANKRNKRSPDVISSSSLSAFMQHLETFLTSAFDTVNTAANISVVHYLAKFKIPQRRRRWWWSRKEEEDDDDDDEDEEEDDDDDEDDDEEEEDDEEEKKKMMMMMNKMMMMKKKKKMMMKKMLMMNTRKSNST